MYYLFLLLRHFEMIKSYGVNEIKSFTSVPRESSILSRCFSYQEVLLWKPSVKKAVTLLFLIASTPKWIPLFQCKLWVSLAWFSHISSSFCINRSCTTWHCHQFLLIALPACVCEVNCGNDLNFAYLILCSSVISYVLSTKCVNHCWKEWTSSGTVK